jgi:hypothetical protein
MTKKRAIESLGMLANIVIMATVAYTVIIIVKQTPLPNATKPASK